MEDERSGSKRGTPRNAENMNNQSIVSGERLRGSLSMNVRMRERDMNRIGMVILKRDLGEKWRLGM